MLELPKWTHRHSEFCNCSVNLIQISTVFHKQHSCHCIWEEHPIDSKPCTVTNNNRGLLYLFPEIEHVNNYLRGCLVGTNNLQKGHDMSRAAVPVKAAYYAQKPSTRKGSRGNGKFTMWVGPLPEEMGSKNSILGLSLLANKVQVNCRGVTCKYAM